MPLKFIDEAMSRSEQVVLPCSEDPLPVGAHFVSGVNFMPPYPSGSQKILFGLGCFWGAERVFWEIPGVTVTAVGYAGGRSVNPTYHEVCGGETGHAEVVLVVFDPQKVALQTLLETFWTSHDPTQGMRQGNDRGTQYRSAIYTNTDAQLAAALASRDQYQRALNQSGFAPITTEIREEDTLYFAEEYHQQYLAKNPDGYCGIGGTGVCFEP